MASDSDTEPVVQHRLYWWQPMGTNQDASEYGMWRLTSATGIDDIEEASLSIYPNPVEDVLYFKGDEIVENAKIFNVLGQTVRTYKDIRGNAINVGELVNGVYLISIETAEGRVVTDRFIKE